MGVKSKPLSFLIIFASLVCTQMFLSETHLDLSLFGTGSSSNPLDHNHFIVNLNSIWSSPFKILLSFFTYWSWKQLVLSFIFLIPLSYTYEAKHSFLKTLLFYASTHFFSLIVAGQILAFMDSSPYYTGSLFLILGLLGHRFSKGFFKNKLWLFISLAALLILLIQYKSLALSYLVLAFPAFLWGWFCYRLRLFR